MSRQIELNIGKDLQFIRVNGTLVGGTIGLVLYLLNHLRTGKEKWLTLYDGGAKRSKADHVMNSSTLKQQPDVLQRGLWKAEIGHEASRRDGSERRFYNALPGGRSINP